MMKKLRRRLRLASCGLILFALGCDGLSESHTPPATPTVTAAPTGDSKNAASPNAKEQGPLNLKNTKEQLVADDADLRGSTFHNVNLSGATFDDINLSNVKFNNVNLSGVEITDANIEGMKIDGV
jgi:uncharacterized protein YjbI with pentapeptide repeats